MYKIACNWSEELCELLVSGQVQVDYIKSGAFGNFDAAFERMRSLKPVLLHGLGHFEMAGTKDLSVVDFPRANRLLAECASPHYAMHLAITHADMHEGMSDEDVHARMSANIQRFKQELNVPLLAENIPDAPQEKTLYDHYQFSEADKIVRLIVENEIGLLLDITHAKIACMYRNRNIREYLTALPLSRVREIHVNGSGFDKNGFPDDTHNAMEPADYELLEFVLTHANPEIITLEYIGIPSESREEISRNLKTQLENLNKL